MRGGLLAVGVAVVCGCGGEIADMSESADGSDAAVGITCSWDDSSAEETCTNGAYSVTILCGDGLVCRSPSHTATMLTQVNYCTGQGYVSAFAECGFPYP
jgi:hypothetical protein